MYADTPVDWIVQVQSKVSHAIRHNLGNAPVEVTLYGAESEETTKDYHDWFPQWEVSVNLVSDIDEGYRQALHFLFGEAETPRYTPEASDRLISWLHSEEGERLQAEYHYVQEYISRTQTGKYPIQFQTVDNVVYYKGNILLVKRRSQPGKGLWALPGGFLEAMETCKQGAVRELQEETRLRVRPEWIVSRDLFDHPRRSVRGRTLTNAFLWKIPDSATFPKVKAGSDASRVKWFPLATILEEMGDQLFEDHLDIITTLTKRL
jgi:bifunctional NMN adenylyltransferase/nudix hydrolase